MSYVEKDFNIDADLIREFLKEKESFHPYGQAFPEPVFKLIVDRNSLEGYMFGSSNQHYKFIMQNGMEIILFYQALDIETDIAVMNAMLDREDGPVAARIPVPAGAEPAEFSAPLAAEGVHDLYLVMGGNLSLYTWQAE